MSISAQDAERLALDLAARHERMFWLDGVGGRDWSGRRSIIGYLAEDDISITFHADRREVLRHQYGKQTTIGTDPFTCLESEMGEDDSSSTTMWVGFFGYAARTDMPAQVAGREIGRTPDAVWMRVSVPPTVIDHPTPPGSDLGVPAGDPSDAPPPRYRGAYDAVQSELRRGNSYEVNLTYRETTWSQQPPFLTYQRLRSTNRAPYGGYLQHDGFHLLSASPERFLTSDPRGFLETKPMKGTRPRRPSSTEDARSREELLTDPKIRSENLMIVDLLRNDLSMVCAPGSVTVPSLMVAETYSTVHQLVSVVQGQLRPEVTAVRAIHALFPPGSMTGAPKLRTMQIIQEVEDSPRGVYSGVFGWICADGSLDLGVVIRSLVARPDGLGWSYEYGTGGGITVGSDVEDEFAESRWKADRLIAALR